MNHPPLNLLVAGTGAIGCYLGGSLALHGHGVVFLARGQTAHHLRTHGLHLHLPEANRALPRLTVVESGAAALGHAPYDAILLAVKSYDTAAMVETLRPFQRRLAPIICLQNGIGNEKLLGEAFGPEHVVAATVTTAVGRPAPGTIVVERLRGVGLVAEHPIVHPLTAAMNAAGLNARLYARRADLKWSKLLTNLLANPTSAILDLAPAEIFAHPGLFRLEIAQLREALAVMQALHARVVDLPGVPVRLLAFAAQKIPLALARPLLASRVGKGRGGKMPSFHIDLYAGNPKSEISSLHGAVVRHGAAVGVDAPANQFLTETLLALVRGEIPRDTYARQPEKLLAKLLKAFLTEHPPLPRK